MPSASAFLNEPDAPSASAFLGEEPTPQTGEVPFLERLKSVLTRKVSPEMAMGVPSKEELAQRSPIGELTGIEEPAFLREPSPPFLHGFEESVKQAIPQTGGQAGQMIGEIAGAPLLGAGQHIYETGSQLADLIRGKSLPEIQEEAYGPRKEYPEFTAEDWGKWVGQLGLESAMALPIARGLLHARPSPLRPEPVVPPEVPLAERITQPRVEPAPQEPLAPVTPETPPVPETITVYHKTPNQFEVFDPEKATPTGLGGKGVFFNANPADTAYGDRSIAVTIPKDKILTHAEADQMPELKQGGNLDEIIQSKGYLGVEGPRPGDVILYRPNELLPPPESPPPVTSAERNAQILERRNGILARKAELTARAANGEQGLEGHLAAVEADLNDLVTNPVVHAPPETPAGQAVPPEKVQPGEFAKPGYTALPTELPTEPVAAPEPYTPEAAAARAAEPVVEPAPETAGELTALKNAITAAEREARGLSPREQVEKRSWEQAKAIAEAGGYYRFR